MRHRAALFIRQSPAPNSAPDEPQSFFIGDTPSSEDDPFGCGGDFDQDHQDMPDQDLQSSSTRPINHAGMNLDLLPGHVMEEAKSGGASMEEDEPEEDPFGRGGDLSQDHQDTLDQRLLLSPIRSNHSADAYPNLLPHCGMEEPKTPGAPTPGPHQKQKIGQMRSGQIRSTKIGQIRPNKDGQMRPITFGQMWYWPNSVWPNAAK